MRLCAVNNVDFSCDSVHPSGFSAQKDCHANRPTCLCTNHAASAAYGVFANGETSPRRAQSSCVHLPRPISRARLCTVDRTRFLAGHRSKSSRTSKASISLGLSLQDDITQHLDQCQQPATVSRVYRVGATPDAYYVLEKTYVDFARLEGLLFLRHWPLACILHGSATLLLRMRPCK